jgi:hypothetical protein
MIPMSQTLRPTLVLLALALTGLASSCNTLSSQNMVPREVEVQNLHKASVRVRAHGSERSLTGHRTIKGAVLQEAVVKALQETRIFSEVLESNDAEYELIVTVLELIEPEIELDMQASLKCEWTLIPPAGDMPPWKDTISTRFVATTFDANFLKERGELALEGVVRANVRQGLERLSALQLER